MNSRNYFNKYLQAYLTDSEQGQYTLRQILGIWLAFGARLSLLSRNDIGGNLRAPSRTGGTARFAAIRN